MSLVGKVMSEFENGYGGGVIGKIGYYLLMSILFVILLPISLLAMPFIKLSEKRAAKRATKLTRDSGSYDRMRIK